MATNKTRSAGFLEDNSTSMQIIQKEKIKIYGLLNYCVACHTMLQRTSCFYTFCRVPFLFICFTEILYAFEQEHFYIHSVNLTRTETAQTAPFYLNVLNVSYCSGLQNVASKNVGGSCNVLPSFRGMCSFQCHCLKDTASFVVNRRTCIDERGFREGCEYVFGSWTWKHGWKWESKNDPLPVLVIESYGLTSVINASSRLFTKCEITSIDKFSEDGWKSLDPFFYEGPKSVFFKLQGMWHFTWATSELNFSRRHDIEGRFIRINIKCTQNNVINGNVFSSDVYSCVALKITGNITHRYAINTTKDDCLPTSKEEDSEDIFSNRLVLIGVIVGCVLLVLLVGGIVVYCLYGKKYFNFKTAVGIESSVKYNCNNDEMVEHV